MKIRQETEDRFADYVENVLEANGREGSVDPMAVAARTFTVEPSIHQSLMDRMQQDDEGLMGNFNNILVNDVKGQKVFMGTSGKVISSTTNTDNAERKPHNPMELADDSYECRETDFDTVIPFALLDNWARFPDFEARISAWLLREFANDRLKIGFNGIARAANSNRDDNPLGEDVNKGWLQNIREKAPGQVISEIVPGTGKITFGKDGDYKTIDQLVVEAYHDVIPRYQRAKGDIVCYVSEGLLSERHFKVADQDTPTERLAADAIIQRGLVGGRRAEVVPWFPENTLLLTSPDNLSRYEQEGSRRRKIEMAPQLRGYASWESFNEDFPVEELEKAALLENVEPAPLAA